MCFVENLLPQLRASGSARVVTVGAGGMEMARTLDVNDLDLEKPKYFYGASVQFHVGIMNTLYLESLAEKKENESVVFIHSHPGIIRTGGVFRGWQDWKLGMFLATYIMDPMLRLIQFSFEEAAERYLYVVTGGAFGGKGPKLAGVEGRTTKGEAKGGMFLSSKTCDTVLNENELAKLRPIAQEAIWTKTRDTIGPYI